MMKNFWILVFAVFGLVACSENDPAVDPTDDQGQTDDTTDDTSEPGDDFQGTIDWLFNYGGSGDDVANAVVSTTDGGFAVLGYTQSTDGDITDKTATDSDYWVLKLSAAGSIIWSKTYGGTADDRGTDIIETQDGGLAIVGFSRSSDGDATANAGFRDFWIVKLSSSGELQWEHNYGFAGNDEAYSIIQTTEGGYFVSGFLDYSSSDGGGSDGFASAPVTPKHGVGEFWGMHLDANGELIWRRFFGGSDNDRSYQVLQTADGGFLMTGASESNDFDISDPNGSYDFWAVRVNSSGDLLWEKSFGGSEIDIAYGLVQSSTSTYVMVGDSRSTNGDVSAPRGNADLWAVAFDDNGSFLWEESYGGTLFESARSVSMLSGGNLVMAGTSRSSDGQVGSNNGQNDAWVILTQPNGDLIWERSIGGSGVDLFYGSAAINNSSWVVVGDTDSSDGDIANNKGGKDALIVKIK